MQTFEVFDKKRFTKPDRTRNGMIQSCRELNSLQNRLSILFLKRYHNDQNFQNIINNYDKVCPDWIF